MDRIPTLNADVGFQALLSGFCSHREILNKCMAFGTAQPSLCDESACERYDGVANTFGSASMPAKQSDASRNAAWRTDTGTCSAAMPPRSELCSSSPWISWVNAHHRFEAIEAGRLRCSRPEPSMNGFQAEH